jgi:rhodanese-related sulfurtransferase
MEPFKRVSLEEAVSLLDQGYVYVDVRSEPEFEAGHVPGALNVPLEHATESGRTPNGEFIDVMCSAFGKEDKLLLGCRSGKRSLTAARMLIEAGFSNLSELRTGWVGAKDAFGRSELGWSRKGLPVETGNPPGQSYADIKLKKSR